MKSIFTLLLIFPLSLVINAQDITASELDDFTYTTFKRLNIAGASVLVKQNGKIILNKGYGMADLSHDVPATPETKYFLVGPGMFMLSACILQQIEQG